ncbi:putative U box domain, armadillo-like helical, Zinc finger, RING/FYVE/PHD-type [Helianthus annuus]|uniref:U-box domain-containing protein n=2 Tax=Helianthus annuus TaxID=4232 RepID=A0A251SJF0_HELAN|nr:putative U box domain, armadillo-like helical, Zinc finger, RING/FYVE/PHD-type [Helianthus annuus]KAJ0469214.1 putative U box domain, armadillo-like helical, Zinc finger, RING/FYVE/PHD-type [Helianthus annuus]KAJ0840863.1 putative U box domain, armadillo-like helical, Zinc finger, RING/FYVE/PHD-type [Helianthus annuus]KAJ0854302.1 putative U box domain, armadillo-like helical, Zinc finger, RING/FYVE/PHD-type [Helianthus annuus]
MNLFMQCAPIEACLAHQVFDKMRQRKDGVDGQVLDLETAVKDGVLGGGVGFGGGFAEKLDLNKMIEELDLPDVPSVFICPISLEPMEDPVTLCTGQTYERSNILKWFSLGRFTCPTTMQELWDDSVTPNKTLHQLIHTWFSQKYLQMKKKSEDVQGNASEILDTLKKVKGQARIQSLKDLRRIVTNHATARNAVVDKGGVTLLSSLLGPYTSHAIGSEVVSILVNLTLDSASRSNLMQPAKVSLIIDMLNEGSIETKINCTKLIQSLTEQDDCEQIVSSHSLLVGLMRLVRDKRHPSGHLPGLTLLKSVCAHQQVRVLIISIGAVPQLVELLPGMNPECLELALFVLEAVSAVKEGKLALSSCSNTIPNMVRILMRVSESCTQLALSILWSICKLSPEEYSSIAVDVGLAAKLLLVIQSGCDPLLKQRSAELLKLCSLNYTDSIFISKCKLTRTIR